MAELGWRFIHAPGAFFGNSRTQECPFGRVLEFTKYQLRKNAIEPWGAVEELVEDGGSEC